MILNETKPHAETHNILGEKFFSIADQGMIFGILRSKLYSNPILAVCREISCNGRDAMREAGRPNEPISIHLPTGLEPEYRVKDTGVGISPDRMENVFVKYAGSTKRNDNVQTGGWGLGSKTPYAVSTDFAVITIHNNIKYQYSCYIDETRVGKMALLFSEPTTEPNGTEIVIPVKYQDFHLFKQYTEQACRHWSVKPIIINGEIEWQIIKPIIEGNRWVVDISEDRCYYEKHIKLIIDGIEYPLELDAFRKYADTKLIDSCRGNLLMYFETGELSLAANREQIYLDEITQDKIKSRLAQITNEIKQLVDEKIDTFPNLWDANIYYHKGLIRGFSNFAFLGKLTWKGNALHNSIRTTCPIYVFNRSPYNRKGQISAPNDLCLRRSITTHLEFAENSQLFLNDLGIKELTARHIKKAFEQNTNLQSIQVICPNDKQTEIDLNQSIKLDLLAPKKLSEITKAPKTISSNSSGIKLLIFQFDPAYSVFQQVSNDAMKKDKRNKVFCLLDRNDNTRARHPIVSGKRFFNLLIIKSFLAQFPDLVLYGVDQDNDLERVKKEFSAFQSLDKMIETFIKDKIDQCITIKYSHAILHKICDLAEHKNKIEPYIIDKTSPFLARLQMHHNIQKMVSEHSKCLLSIYEAFKGEISSEHLQTFTNNHPELDIDMGNKQYDNQYPLLQYINTYDISRYDTDERLQHIAHYINLIDYNNKLTPSIRRIK